VRAYHFGPKEPFQLGLRIQALRIYRQQVPTRKTHHINILITASLELYTLCYLYSLALDALLIDRSFPRTRLSLSGSFIFRATYSHVIR
jgi:hypothetical protein